VSLASASSDPRSFKLPAFSLDVGTYTLMVTATDLRFPDVNASEVVALTVPRTNVVAAIDGGAARSASAAEDLRVSASSSRDEDVEGVTGAAAGLVFNWTCDDFVLDDAESVVVPAGALAPGRSYDFAVTATAPDGRSSRAEATVHVIANDPPSVAIDASSVGSRVSAGTRVVLFGSINSGALAPPRLNSTWRLTAGALAGGASLDGAARTDVVVSDFALQRDHALVLPAGVLVGGSYALCGTQPVSWDPRRASSDGSCPGSAPARARAARGGRWDSSGKDPGPRPSGARGSRPLQRSPARSNRSRFG
jgi:hypothetical protein